MAAAHRTAPPERGLATPNAGGGMNLPAILKQEPLRVEAGISRLYRVEFERNPDPVLLKEPKHFWDESFIANEAAILGGVTHPRIRRRLAYDAATHRLFLEYVEAATLHELVKAGTTLKDPARTHQILQSVAETMADLHAGILCDRPLVHNDLKSMNVLAPENASRPAVLIDFSHAYFKGELPPLGNEHQPDRMGTAKYMAPEKWEGDYTHGFKSDVFAFGVMAYYCYTGRHPFEGDLTQIEQQIRQDEAPRPDQQGVNIQRTLTAILMLCLEKKPERRPTMEYVARCYAGSAGLVG